MRGMARCCDRQRRIETVLLLLILGALLTSEKTLVWKNFHALGHFFERILWILGPHDAPCRGTADSSLQAGLQTWAEGVAS